MEIITLFIRISLIILIILGLLKLVSLFIMFVIEAYQKIKHSNYLELRKEYGVFYKEDYFYLIPSISCVKCTKYFEVMIDFLKWEYYAAYKLDFNEEE